MLVEPVKIQAGDRTLSGALHVPLQPPWAGCILSHGLLSNKEGSKFVAQAHSLAQSGIAAMRYDHMGCGESGGNLADTTVASRLEDLDAVLTAMRSRFSPDLPLGLGGSSMGGFISLLRAATDERIFALALWATPAFIRPRPGNRQMHKEELIELPDAAQYDLRQIARKVRNTLILHGEADELVPPVHAHQLYECLAEPKRLFLFPDGDHRFLDERQREKAIELSCNWLKTRLADQAANNT